MPPVWDAQVPTPYVYRRPSDELKESIADLKSQLQSKYVGKNGVISTHNEQSPSVNGKTDPDDNDRVLQEIIVEGLSRKSRKEVPYRFLYDDRGSELYESITKLEEYYPFRAEIDLLDEFVEDITNHIPDGSLVVELGCGSALKTAHLLNALVARHGRCRFVGIDVSESFLDEARCNLMLLVEGHLTVDLVPADYIEGLRQVRAKYPNDSLCVVWLGSGVGNFSQKDAIYFFEDVSNAVKSRCRLFLCTDMWKKDEILRSAYHDKQGVTEAFIRNGMSHALRILGHEPATAEELSSVYEVEINQQLKQVEMYLRFPQGFAVPKHGIHIRPGERVLMEISRKFTRESIHKMTENAGFHLQSAWHNQIYGCQMLLDEYEAITQCWQDTDVLFEGIPDWSSKPIDTRHPFCFYYGHLPAFAKLKIFADEPAQDMDIMFSRGIDPFILDTSQCHNHPKTPAEWPSRDQIVAYASATRKKILNALHAGQFKGNHKLITFVMEHERMHQETLAYMMTQERKAAFEKAVSVVTASQLPPIHISSIEPPSTMSIINALAKSKMVTIEAGPVVLGSYPKETGFLWDNEYPQYSTSTSSTFWVSSRPVSIGEFHRFVKEGGYENEKLWDAEDFVHFQENGYKYPASWSLVEKEFFVHEYQSTNHWSRVANHPVFVSLSEAEAFCKWLGCRVFSEAEYQRVLDVDPAAELVQQMRVGGYEWTSTPFQGFPGFEPMPEYPEYSTDFFDGRHFVLKGSSPVTHPSMKRDSFRNYFQKQYRYAFAKFRCSR
ncbi:hypothetical protein MPTK1_3g17070 [Marchantia polymorpha subsp. ruderalis]|uniref:Sulfatase-modifying factor enzyme domain-containing protein n=2 Tax=Marchantia polymorpha TaxID=3197 RepID=A0AAF6B1P2_MARPO|nr:hypothetical protein MARPO_0039s0087 [Marchantia polymorpha]BBN05926.1 hypothetical protein Mp_3g17070 [Marchantia polymorpha subsp. ruderalis]|eukprot:PTQ40598.1 hypothetical protein MARPO_0039s0087 [Marchantia polymorpha]